MSGRDKATDHLGRASTFIAGLALILIFVAAGKNSVFGLIYTTTFTLLHIAGTVAVMWLLMEHWEKHLMGKYTAATYFIAGMFLSVALPILAIYYGGKYLKKFLVYIGNKANTVWWPTFKGFFTNKIR